MTRAIRAALALSQANLVCLDCGADLLGRTDFEPFMFRCYCGEWEHVRLCSACIGDTAENTGYPHMADGPHSALAMPHAHFANSVLSDDIFADCYHYACTCGAECSQDCSGVIQQEETECKTTNGLY